MLTNGDNDPPNLAVITKCFGNKNGPIYLYQCKKYMLPKNGRETVSKNSHHSIAPTALKEIVGELLEVLYNKKKFYAETQYKKSGLLRTHCGYSGLLNYWFRAVGLKVASCFWEHRRSKIQKENNTLIAKVRRNEA